MQASSVSKLPVNFMSKYFKVLRHSESFKVLSRSAVMSAVKKFYLRKRIFSTVWDLRKSKSDVKSSGCVHQE